MRIITWYFVVLICAFAPQWVSAQEETQEDYKEKIELLEEQKSKITQQEKTALKYEVSEINKLLDKGIITPEEAANQKGIAAEKRALNIEERIAIIENKISLLNRNEGFELELTESLYFDDEGDNIFRLDIKKIKEPKYQKRTHSDLVFAFGLNNAIRYNESFSDSPYKFFGSRFFEIGYAWNTRLSKNSNWLRLKYGFSFQFNGLKPTENRYFGQVFDDNGFARIDLTTLPGLDGGPDFTLSKSKLRMDNFVFPFHFEFGPSSKRKNGPYVRYSTYNKWKFGIGGYVGFNYKNIQKVKFDKDSSLATYLGSGDGGNQKTIFGISSYFGVGDVSLYFKYDLTQIFPGPSLKQNNISLGVRLDL